MNQKLRKLVQQLGEAIHETVSESENIAGVVQNIRKQGFDVLLMLEATIGLNELEQQPGMAVVSSNALDKSGELDQGESGEDGPFSVQDLSFLHSLRITVDGEEDGGEEGGK